MHKAAIVCCGARDEAMLPLFIARWRTLTDVPLWLGNCTRDPVTDTHGLPTVPITWGAGVGKTIIAAMLAIGADLIAKLDVDSYLLSTDWLWTPYQNTSINCVGIQILAHPGNFWGIAYSLRRTALLALEKNGIPCQMQNTEDDTEICQAIRLLDPNSVYLHPVLDSIRRSDTYDPKISTLLVLHCGIYGRTRQARAYALEELQRLHHGNQHTIPAPVWVSLAIMPHRFANGIDVIQTLLRQTHPPQKICIAISPHYTRTGQAFTPDQLHTLKNISPLVHIVTLPDHGPVSKYLAAESAPEGTLILTLDDDRIYSLQLIERMAHEYLGGLLANQTTNVNGTTIAEAFAGVMWEKSAIDFPRLKALIRQLQYAARQSIAPDFLLADDAIISHHIGKIQQMKKPVGNRENTSSQDATALHKTAKGHRDRYDRLLDYLTANPAPK